MNKIYATFIMLGLYCSSGHSQYVNFTKQNNGTNSISVPIGEAWQLVSLSSQDISIAVFSTEDYSSYVGEVGSTRGISVGMEGAANNQATGSSLGSIFVGPTLLKPSGIFANSSCYYNLVFKKIGSSNSVSATSVVIPSSATGDVDVKLEQSADNVTWTECLPGTYNSSTVKRFFRLRAVEK